MCVDANRDERTPEEKARSEARKKAEANCRKAEAEENRKQEANRRKLEAEERRKQETIDKAKAEGAARRAADEETARRSDEEAKVKAEEENNQPNEQDVVIAPMPDEPATLKDSADTEASLTKLEVDKAAVPVKGTVFSGRSAKVSPAVESEVELVEPEPTAAASTQALSAAAAKLVEDMKAAQPWKRSELVGAFAQDEANSLAVSELPAILKLATVNTKAQVLIDLIPACFRFATGDPDKTRAELEACVEAMFEGDSFNTRKVLAELEGTKPSTAEPAVVLHGETTPSPTDEQVEEPALGEDAA